MDGETEAQQVQVLCPRSHNQKVTDLDIESWPAQMRTPVIVLFPPDSGTEGKNILLETLENVLPTADTSRSQQS